MLMPPVDALSFDGDSNASPRGLLHSMSHTDWDASQEVVRQPSPRAWHFLARKPRDGPLSGGGHMKVYDHVKVAEIDMVCGGAAAAIARQGSKKRAAAARSSSASDGGSSSSNRGHVETAKPADIEEMLPPQEARRKAELRSKFHKTEAQRERDRELIQDRLERSKSRRDERFNRMVEHVLGRDNLAYQAAVAIRERDSHQERRRRELHAAYDEAVAQPLAEQLYQFMNPPNRARQQALAGCKTVDFKLPSDGPSLFVEVEKDPVKQTLTGKAVESQFHTRCASLLGPRAHSAPAGDQLRPARTMPHPGEAVGMATTPVGQVAGLIARGRSRPTLEPCHWNPAQLQGTIFGHFAQSAEHGPGFRRVLRGGHNVHAPDETDGVEAAGKRTTRATGHKDLGILKGTLAARGEASMSKTMLGASTGAIMQDHYQYETGPRVIDLEFPKGKRCFPGLTGA